MTEQQERVKRRGRAQDRNAAKPKVGRTQVKTRGTMLRRTKKCEQLQKCDRCGKQTAEIQDMKNAVPEEAPGTEGTIEET